MGKLHDEMLMEMHLRNYSRKTIKSYISHMKSYTRYFGKSPTEMGDDEIRRYLYYMKVERQLSVSNITQAYSALRFFYTTVLDRTWNIDRIPRPKQEKKLPVVLSFEEVGKLFAVTTNLKHRVILMTAYAGGLRVKETTQLKVADIDSKRMAIRVEQSKGRKDRYTLLSGTLLPALREYYRRYRPQTWLFPGKDPDTPLTSGTLQKVFNSAKKKPASASLRLSTPCATALPPTF